MTIGRLKKRAEFLAVNAANRKFVTHGMIVQVRGQTPPAGLRIGFTVSRKVGNAVARNRARRRLRAAAAEILSNHDTLPHDLVLIGRVGTLNRPWDDLRGDLAYAMRKLGLIKP